MMNTNIKVNGELFKIETVVKIESGKDIIFLSNNQIDNNGLIIQCGELTSNSINNISEEEWVLAKNQLRNALFDNIPPINFTLNSSKEYDNNDGLRAIRVDYQKITEYNNAIFKEKQEINSDNSNILNDQFNNLSNMESPVTEIVPENIVLNEPSVNDFQSTIMNQINDETIDNQVNYSDPTPAIEIVPNININDEYNAINGYSNAPTAYDSSINFKRIYELMGEIAEELSILEKQYKNESDGAIIHQFPNRNLEYQDNNVQSKIS